MHRTSRTREFRGALSLELRRSGRGVVAKESSGEVLESHTLSRAAAVSKKLEEIEHLVQRLEDALRGQQNSDHFEVVMESVAVDCKWVDKALTVATAEAEKERGQRKKFEQQISLVLRRRLEYLAKKVQACADLRQKTLQEQQQRRHKLSRAGPAMSAKVQLDTPLFSSAYSLDAHRRPALSGAGGLRSRRTVAAHRAEQQQQQLPPPPQNSRLQLQQQQQKQRQQFILEETSRRRLDHAHSIEREIGKLGEIFSKFSTLVAQQAEVVERLDDDVENARGEVEAGHEQLTSAQAIIQGNRSLLIKVFAIIIVFIIFTIR